MPGMDRHIASQKTHPVAPSATRMGRWGTRYPAEKFALEQRHGPHTQLRSRPADYECKCTFRPVGDEHDVLRGNDMSRYKVLAELFDELRNIQVLDRIHDYAIETDPINERAYEIRQGRRKQILDEIARLRTSKSERVMRAVVGSAALLVCVVGYAMLLHLLK
jgi:hypothetical protein